MQCPVSEVRQQQTHKNIRNRKIIELYRGTKYRIIYRSFPRIAPHGSLSYGQEFTLYLGHHIYFILTDLSSLNLSNLSLTSPHIIFLWSNVFCNSIMQPGKLFSSVCLGSSNPLRV